MITIIYLIGKPGTGKYTIAKELSKSGYIICDNQLINNPIFALLVLLYDFNVIPAEGGCCCMVLEKCSMSFLRKQESSIKRDKSSF